MSTYKYALDSDTIPQASIHYSIEVREYDMIADWYASERTHSAGVPEAVKFASSLAPHSRILDIGCGNGIPITQALIHAGHSVVGLDSSSKMLERFRANCPEARGVLGTIQDCPFEDLSFDAAIAWGVIFHLTPKEQIRSIRRLARLVRLGGPFLFTSGDVDGFRPKEGSMNGVTFRYYSLSVENYRRILLKNGFRLVEVHQDSGQNTYYSAIRQPVS
jgi:SAM-dependent methyltransferase